MLRATVGDPSRKEPFSVPTKDPRVDVAPARAVLDGRVSPEKEQRVNAQESEIRGQAALPKISFESFLCFSGYSGNQIICYITGIGREGKKKR